MGRLGPEGGFFHFLVRRECGLGRFYGGALVVSQLYLEWVDLRGRAGMFSRKNALRHLTNLKNKANLF
jgi:hypothetical protein